MCVMSTLCSLALFLAIAVPPIRVSAEEHGPASAVDGVPESAVTSLASTLPIAAQLGVIGGRNLRLTTGTATTAPVLLWDTGDAPGGYQIPAMGGFADELVFLPLPQGSTLAPGTTTFTDSRAFNRLVYCYAVLALGTSPTGVLANSDVLCQMPFMGSASAGAVTISLNQTSIATLSWTHPTDGPPGAYALFRVSPFGGGTGAPQIMPGSQTSTFMSTLAEPSCFVLVGLGGGAPTVYDIVCAFPGMSSFATAASVGSPKSATQAGEAIQQDLARRARAR
jgi:hypothetical protein